MYLVLLLLCVLGYRKVESLVLNLPQIITTPMNSSHADLASNASTLTPSALEDSIASFPMSYSCDEKVFGQPNFYSCMDAYTQMPPGRYARSYGDRENRQPYDFPLPLRYASGKWQLVEDSESMAQTDDVPGDGTCIIEVFPIVEGFSDLMKPLDLKMAVQNLIQDCVAGDNPKGGIAERMGKFSLGITVESK